MVSVELLVNDVFADELQNDGFAEIAFRRSDAKFREMIKCKLATDAKTNGSSYEELSSKALGLDVKAGDIHAIRKNINSINANSSDIKEALERMPSSFKNMVTRMDGIYQGMDAVKGLAYMNIGLSMVNMAVDLIGFKIVSDNLGKLNESLVEISKTIEKMAVVQSNERIKDCDKLIMQFNSLASKIQDDDCVDMDKVDNWLIEAKAYISEMLSNLSNRAMSIEVLLNMIYTLIPSYSIMLSYYLKQYYFQKQKRPLNYDIYLSLFDKIMEDSLDKKLFDYYVLEKHYSLMDAANITDAQLLLSLNAKILIEDQQVMMESLKTKENFEAVDKKIDNIAHERFEEMIQALSDETGISQEEYAQLLNSQV